jgi:hypothetical protein
MENERNNIIKSVEHKFQLELIEQQRVIAELRKDQDNAYLHT